MWLLHKRRGCIGCGVCPEIAPLYWKMEKDGKATLIGGKLLNKMFFGREVDDEELALHKETAKHCPVKVIVVEKRKR